MIKHIRDELVEHLPFTIVGAAVGIVLMVFFRAMSREAARTAFYLLHPAHVFLSALATTSIYHLHKHKRVNIGVLLLIGYGGAIGVATLSDSLIPYIGERILNLPHSRVHIGFIEKWWLINPVALIGIAVAYFFPSTKFPHAGHVLISTWASLFHVIMALGEHVSWLIYGAIFVFLTVSVWIPCCVSDIIFPLLFVKEDKQQ